MFDMLNLPRHELKIILLIAVSLMLFTGPVFASSEGINGPSEQCNSYFQGGTTFTGQSLVSQTLTTANSAFGNAIAASAIALMLSFMVISIGYILNKLIPTAKISNWIGNEYWETTKSAILIASIFSVIAFVSSIGVILSGQPTQQGLNNLQTLSNSAETYLCTVNSQANLSLTQVVPLLMGLGMVQSPGGGAPFSIAYTGIGIPIGPVVFRTGADFPLFNSLLLAVQFVFLPAFMSLFIDFMLFLIVPIKMFYSVQVILLPYLMTVGLTILIPTGIIFRAFPFIRGIGGTLIAFGLGFAVIWPTILVVLNAPISSYFCSAVGTSLCVVVGPSSIQSVTQPSQTTTLTSSSIGQSALNLMQSVCNYITACGQVGAALTAENNVYPTLNLMEQYGLYLILQLFVLLIIDIILFFAITDSVARMLGGTIRLSLGRKMKLV